MILVIEQKLLKVLTCISYRVICETVAKKNQAKNF